MKAIIKNSLLDALSRDRLYDLAGVIMDFPETNTMLSLLKDKWLKFPILLKRLQWLNRQCFSSIMIIILLIGKVYYYLTIWLYLQESTNCIMQQVLGCIILHILL